MNLLIFGASGATGRQLVDQALAGGHAVSAFVRDPARLPIEHPRLRVAVGDVMKPETVDAVVPGHDAVLSALGNFPEGRENRARWQLDVPVCSEGTRNVMRAMNAAGCRRLVVESSVGVGESVSRGRFGAAALMRLFLRKVLEDKERLDALLFDSELDWTIVRPPRLTHGPARGALRSGEELAWSLLSKASRADVAAFMLRILDDPSTHGKALTIKE